MSLKNDTECKAINDVQTWDAGGGQEKGTGKEFC